MKPELLHVVTVVSNPIRWVSRIRLFRQFADHMRASGVHLTVVECQHGRRPHELHDVAGIQHIPVSARTMVWNKENLLNIAISRLPADWKYVAWLDADILFRRTDWAAETVQKLQIYDVIQPWSDCYDLGPNDEHVQHHRSFCSLWCEGKPVGKGNYTFAHPGYAWAANRRAIELLGGLIDTGALGAADHHMALALLGRVEESVHGGMGAAYRAPLLAWQRRALQHIGQNLGYVQGTIEHHWHGTKDSRNYIGRWDVLVRHKFDPSTDLMRNAQGVMELAGNKPGLRRDIDRYFRQRFEDSNSMHG